MTTVKTGPRVNRFSELNFVPRFEYGHMAQVVEVAGENDGSELGCGFGRFTHAQIPWTIRYDEVLTVIEGQLEIRVGDQSHVLNERDSIWLPAGTELVYQAESALVHYAIHPANWNSET